RTVESRFMQDILKPKKTTTTGKHTTQRLSSLNSHKNKDKNSNKILGIETGSSNTYGKFGQTTQSIITHISQLSSISLDDELTMLNARMTQWCFLNAKADHAFECQKRFAE
ncbi:9524_t:CDS:2, partial [Dentiscutata erythropus]